MGENHCRECDWTGSEDASGSLREWKNIHPTAKREFCGCQKEIRRTGDGPAPKSPSVVTNKIADMFRDAPSFVGLDGFESGKFQETKQTHSPLLGI